MKSMIFAATRGFAMPAAADALGNKHARPRIAAPMAFVAVTHEFRAWAAPQSRTGGLDG